jgi:hypothetical protein
VKRWVQEPLGALILSGEIKADERVRHYRRRQGLRFNRMLAPVV